MSRPTPSARMRTVRIQSGAQVGASFWKKDLPVMPSG
jgi:hypothetical protein